MFGFADVVENISTKMIDRHPHIFGDRSRDKSPSSRSKDWEAIKAGTRRQGRKGVLDGVAFGLPALTGAEAAKPRRARRFRLARPADVLKENRRGKPRAGRSARQRRSRPFDRGIRRSCCSSWRHGIWTSTPKRPCAWPTPSSPAASGRSRPRWPPPAAAPRTAIWPRWTRPLDEAKS